MWSFLYFCYYVLFLFFKKIYLNNKIYVDVIDAKVMYYCIFDGNINIRCLL